ncbi:MAG: nucleotidyltransferase domain-containing protein [Thermodesulfovibrionales bacterium]|nr:nucleotidyltransferase domain-containing protein [Thermodesulfovibrionales bacterium]
MKATDKIIKMFITMLSPFRKEIKEVYLFGSRCRDDWKPDSDYDILIVLKKKDRKTISKLYDAVMDILITTGRLISLKIFSASEFDRLKSIPTPFMHNVISEGIKLGKNN